MPVTQRKPSTPNTRRRLEDFPEWQQALEMKRKLGQEQEAIANRFRQFDGWHHPVTATEGRVNTLMGKLLAKVSGTAEPAPAFSEADGTALAERREACQRAIEQHERNMNALRHELMGEIYESWEEEHSQARKLIARMIVETKKAIDAEQKLANEMAAAGAIVSVLWGQRPWVNTSNCAGLPAVFRPMNLRAFVASNTNLL
jgi:hypothetical protein